MTIEHLGFQVEDPGKAAEWYEENLGFTTVRSADDPLPVRFVADSSGKVMIEIYRNPTIEVPDYPSMNPLELHLALSCDDVDGTVEKLVAVGATVAADAVTTPVGDRLAMLRDPWGVPVQLCKRAKPLV